MDEKIKEKLTKLKALTDSPNEHEAARALEFMKKYMDKHDISENILEKLDDGEGKVNEEVWRKPNKKNLRNWEIRLATCIAKLFDCKIIILIDGGRKYFFSNKKRTGLIFLGIEEDYKIAIDMYDWMNKIIWDLSIKESFKSEREYLEIIREKYPDDIDYYSYLEENPFSIAGFRFSFLAGAVHRLESRINNILDDRKNNTPQEYALILSNKKLEKIQVEMDGRDLSDAKTSLSFSDLDGYLKGEKTGDEINFDKQLKSEELDRNFNREEII